MHKDTTKRTSGEDWHYDRRQRPEGSRKKSCRKVVTNQNYLELNEQKQHRLKKNR